MAEPTIQLGGGNWAGKTDNLLGYYKEGERFYKQDFTFSRTTTGTYTDSDGYIQEMPYNLLQQSNQFDTTWTLSASIDLTSGQSGYDGSNDAWLLKRNSTGSRYVQQNLTRPSGQYSFSVYLKAESTDWVYVWAYDGSNQVNAYFDLNNGVVGNTSGLDSTNVVSVGNDWYRCTITFTQAITSVRIYPAYANGSISTGTDNGIYIQDAQLNKGTSAKTYFPTTTRLNMPRVDYLNNSNGSLILEPQRTNLIRYSEDYSQWSAISSVINKNAISPSGDLNATTITDNGSGGSSGNVRIQAPNFSITASTQYTFSAYVKANPNTQIKVTTRNDDALRGGTFNISTLTFTPEQGTEIGSVESIGNGYYRIITTWTSGSDTSVGIGIGFPNITRDGTNSFILWGAQVESGSYPTTLINTSGSSVTRNADACELTNVADRIGQTEGTIYAEIDFKSKPESGSPIVGIISLNNNVGNLQNTIILGIERQSGGINRFYPFVQVSNSTVASIIGTTLTDGNYKAAFAYKQNDFVLYVNGIQIGTDNLGTVPTTSQILVGQRYNNDAFKFGDGIKETKIYNTRLSNSELATLTT